MSLSSSNELLHIWKTYNDANEHFLELYRSFQTRTNPPVSTVSDPLLSNRTSARTSTRRPRTTQETTPSWLQHLFSAGRSPYVSDISYSWIFEIPTSSGSNTTRLTQKQIQENTRTFVYDENGETQLITNTCPISHNDFQNGDILCEINSCKHVFKQAEILRWFDVNHSCPVCRTPVVSETPSSATSATTTATNDTPVFRPQILEEIVLTPVFPSSNTATPSLDDNDHLTQIMNEALESIFSGRNAN